MDDDLHTDDLDTDELLRLEHLCLVLAEQCERQEAKSALINLAEAYHAAVEHNRAKLQ